MRLRSIEPAVDEGFPPASYPERAGTRDSEACEPYHDVQGIQVMREELTHIEDSYIPPAASQGCGRIHEIYRGDHAKTVPHRFPHWAMRHSPCGNKRLAVIVAAQSQRMFGLEIHDISEGLRQIGWRILLSGGAGARAS
jgi:hypothetical protein